MATVPEQPGTAGITASNELELLLNALSRVRHGDFTARLPEHWTGVHGKIADAFNDVVGHNQRMAEEMERVRRAVGGEGKTTQRLSLNGSEGSWHAIESATNGLIADLSWPIGEVARVIGAVNKGDLTQEMLMEVEGRPLKGELARAAKAVNTMVSQLSGFTSEVIRVAREVGAEGKLGGQAQVKGLAGTWKELADTVNGMAANLTSQVRNIAEVAIAVAQGDLAKKITVDVRGEILLLKEAINGMVEQLRSFSQEVIRVAREVGTDGKLGGQAVVPGVAGVWKDLTDNVNTMATNLTMQVRNIAEVTTAVARGDLSRSITVEVRGELLDLKRTINTMVEQLNGFSAEVTRVAREVGTEGKLGGQAEVAGASGVWKDLTDNVNTMASNLTAQVRNIADVAKAVAGGDLSRKITVDVKGEILELKDTINVMVDQLNAFSAEVTRVAREVGTEGKLGGQAEVKGASGVWKDLTDNVNTMASNLTAQVRNIADVAKAVAGGDLSRKITVDVKGEILELKDTINVMVDQLNAFSAEVTRVAREVGSEGKLGGQAEVKGVSGVWRDLTDSVNFMAANLTAQVRNIAEVSTAVAGGDLSRKITVDVKGEVLELKVTINTMVDQLNAFAAEVTRVAREVGTEGKLGGQADVPGVGGTWKDLTDNVNGMAANLTAQMRNIADVTKAVAGGDLSRKITVDVKGEILEMKSTINTMVDQLNAFSSEVTRVAREVGTEGKLGGQADVKGVSGVWRDLTDSVNFMAANLTAQVRNIAEVTTAVANGDLSRKITVDVKGEVLELKGTINTMVEQLRAFASEVTRVAREVGTEGKLGGQADVQGVSGVWKDLTDSVNNMGSNLTDQVRNIAEVASAIASGDLSRKITVDVRGEVLRLKDTINGMVDQLRAFASEVTRVAREVGTDGRLGGQASIPGAAGVWKDLTDSVNLMASNLTAQVRNIAQVTTAVANGDLSRKITVDVKGEILELKDTINTMVDQLNAFGAEVTRVAREVGSEGKLGGQARVPGVAGVWKDLTDNVNGMAANLTDQVREIAKIVTTVANGNLKQKLALQARGEIAVLADTINAMIDTLATFGEQVTTVAKEVGLEGKLGGQAEVPGAAGSWSDLVNSVNRLAANLTTQVRAIAEVATAVTRGDLSRSVQVEASGEVLELRNTINEMIRNLRDTTRQNTEQDWLKTNLTRFTRVLQGQRDMQALSERLLTELAPLINMAYGVFYAMETREGGQRLVLLSSYGYTERKNISSEWGLRQGLVGQCAFEKQRILLTNVPNDYVQITSGLGQARPLNMIVLPILFEGDVKAVIELASFELFNPIQQGFLDQLTESIGIVLNTIEASQRTETLLRQSQALTETLQSQQDELQQTNEELEEKARQLAEQNIEVERKNSEVEEARRALEDKAEQLALTSRYKSEFLANMSHELRTPLNSLLLLAQQLSHNDEKNLTGRQVEFARTIHGAGTDLLNLINDILDLSKIESGTVSLEMEDLPLSDVCEQVERTFRHVAESKGVALAIEPAPGLPPTFRTDRKRLMQVVKNLLSNAFKFTERGQVALRIFPATSGWSKDHPELGKGRGVIAFSVADTGVGIPKNMQRIIFEAFQQADASASRKHGGAGLGLAISREIATLLGGEIRLVSEPGEGSVFTLYLPLEHRGGGGRIVAEQPTVRTFQAALVHPQAQRRPEPAQPAPFTVEDDRAILQEGDSVLLIVEDDADFARILVDMARERGFKAVATPRGEEGLALARELKPAAISLDLHLPDGDGWTVMDRLKADHETRHIPVHIISVEEDRLHGLERGAFAYLTKPVSREAIQESLARLRRFVDRKVRRLLVVEDDEDDRRAIAESLGDSDVGILTVGTGTEALATLRSDHYDCVVLDLNLPDMSGSKILEAMQADPTLRDVPVVVYTAEDLGPAEEATLHRAARSVVLKGERSMDRLLAETALFLHRVSAEMPEARRQVLERMFESDAALQGKKVLVVDDDVRNVFALTSVLERHGMVVQSVDNGRAALEVLERTPDVNVVLMDIMMPEMDGYETTRTIRRMARYKNLPVLALTAKAMKGDRDKCLEAGASDYISKPVSTERLLSLLRVWLYR